MIKLSEVEERCTRALNNPRITECLVSHFSIKTLNTDLPEALRLLREARNLLHGITGPNLYWIRHRDEWMKEVQP